VLFIASSTACNVTCICVLVDSKGSVLGPILFIIYINDLEEGLSSKVFKFADDTKLAHRVSLDGEIGHLQENLNVLIRWSIN